MIVHPLDPALSLLEVSDIDVAGTIVDWARQYLCRPHPELGRKGPTCPYTQPSLDKGRFYVSIFAGPPASVDEIIRCVEVYRDWFVELAPREQHAAQFTTILVAFPELGGRTELIDEAQRRLKTGYVELGLMIGEFHDGPPDKAGLWNADFRPLVSPVPLLAIRHMVPTDLPFLRDDQGQLSAYQRYFGHRVPSHLRETPTAVTVVTSE